MKIRNHYKNGVLLDVLNTTEIIVGLLHWNYKTVVVVDNNNLIRILLR